MTEQGKDDQFAASLIAECTETIVKLFNKNAVNCQSILDSPEAMKAFASECDSAARNEATSHHIAVRLLRYLMQNPVAA